ncbi:hypothetical protein [Nonomuraea typhae]|uniref:hypothetical protein n=1 Tax=Nonomuraea typhae TaxID=2603600 RepID=UPI0012FCD496|nr:hypothetical protein [Nonomuraea typhae]
MSGAYTVEWADHVEEPADDVLAVVLEALVPMIFWPRVAIRRAIDEDLSAVEMFLLEAAVSLGWLTAEVVEEITDLPTDVITAVTDGLVEFGLLTRNGTTLNPVEDEIAQTLGRETLRRHAWDTCSVLYLPHTHEAVAFGVPARGRRRRSPPPAYLAGPGDRVTAPVGPDLMGTDPARLLSELLVRGDIARLPEDVIGIGPFPEDEPVPESCPVYRVEGVVRTGTPRVDLYVLTGDQRVRLDLSGAETLAGRWLRLAGFLKDPGGSARAAEALGCDAGDLVVEDGRVLLNARAATAVGNRLSLATSGGFHVTDRQTVISVPIDLRPADLEAAILFALDRAAANMRGAGSEQAGEILARACREHDLPEDALPLAALADRLWGLAQYDLVYMLRAPRDFAYD